MPLLQRLSTMMPTSSSVVLCASHCVQAFTLTSVPRQQEPVKRMQHIQEELRQHPAEEEAVAKQEALLEELIELVENIDFARGAPLESPCACSNLQDPAWCCALQCEAVPCSLALSRSSPCGAGVLALRSW